MALTQLDPMLPVMVNGKGSGYAMGIIDYSQEHSLLFVCIMDETGEIWTVPNAEVRAKVNYSMGRHKQDACDQSTPYSGACSRGTRGCYKKHEVSH